MKTETTAGMIKQSQSGMTFEEAISKSYKGGFKG